MTEVLLTETAIWPIFFLFVIITVIKGTQFYLMHSLVQMFLHANTNHGISLYSNTD